MIDITRDKEYYKWPHGTKKALLERDGKCCVICQSQQGLVIHHYWERFEGDIKSPYYKNCDGKIQPRFDMNNLALLCRSCHGKVHTSNRNSPFIRMFYLLMDEKQKLGDK